MRHPSSLLLITAAGEDLQPVNRLLTPIFPALRVQSVVAASSLEAALEKRGFDLALIDGQLPWADWQQVVRGFTEKAPHCPVILLADSRQEEAACKAMSWGLDDYVVKSEDRLRRLPWAVQAAWRRAERHRARLEDAEDRYRAIFDNSNDVMLVHDPETGQILDANREACARTGYTVEEFQRLSAGDLSLGEEPYTQKEAMRLILEAAAGESPRVEWLSRYRNGKLHWTEVQLKKVCLQGQTRVLVIGRDISLRKRNQEALQESEHRYQTLLHSAGDAIFIHNPDGRILEVNRAAGEILGYTPEELLQMRLSDLEVPLGPTSLPPHASDSLSRLHGLVELGLRRRDGLTLPVERSSRVIEYAGMQVIMSIARDISARRQAEEALRLSEKKYRTIFANTGTALTIIEEDTRFYLVNHEFVRLSGYTRRELEGKMSWTEFVSQEDLGRLQEYHRRRRIDPHSAPRNYEFRFLDRAGRRRDILATIAMVPGTSRSVASLLDITARKRAEEERAQLEAQLRQAQKMEAVGTLAGGIAHDFNNLLHPILVNTEMVLEHLPPDHHLRRKLDRVLMACHCAIDLVKQILAFSRQEEQELKPVDLGPIVTEGLQMLRASLPGATEIRTHLAKGTGTVLADATQIQQVLINLCTNAAHALRARGGILEVNLAAVEVDAGSAARHQDLTPGPYLKLTVRDTGSGMTPAVMERIFDPYYTTKKVGEGTGLGLAVAHGIIKRHGGAINVTSALGQGTTFEIYLPRVELPRAARPRTSPPTSLKTP